MEFKAIRTENGDILISDSTTVQRYSPTGTRIFRNVPSPKMFRELCYITSPQLIEAQSKEELLASLEEQV